MRTIVRKINAENMTSEDFAEAARLLREGRLVAFPTETVYGLGGDAFDPTASRRIYEAKGRPSDNPLIVHIARLEELENLCEEIPEEAYRLADAFWPGPLTMILKKKDCIPKETTGGLDTVAIRMPSHPIANRLILEAGLPIAAPSANASGRPSTTKAEHVIEDLDGRIDMIIDGGSSDIGLESTIVDLTVSPALILRPGYITVEMLKKVLPDISYDPAVLKREKNENIVAKAPGMKYRHYAPKGDLTIFEGADANISDEIEKQAEMRLSEGHRVGVLCSTELAGQMKEVFSRLCASEYGKKAFCDKDRDKNEVANSENGCNNELVYFSVLGSRSDEGMIAQKLFDALRSFDEKGIEYIYAESFSTHDLGQAIMNRLIKAAGYHIVQV